ncbi:hypothetical protein SO802_033244 [Lithocarpus litseifolius]|uniref:AB hydrolase-1 domain-containing protein n=1 Tax=Lithocarpus litseifolius TaxID=425828 RepID=A0AAW2BFZ2_9ROSI
MATVAGPLTSVASVTSSAASYTSFHIVGDLVGLLDHLGIDQVFLVGHDWGAMMAWNFCMFRPDRVKALVNLSVPYLRRNPAMKPVDSLRALLGDDYYFCRFQEPGEVEKDFAFVDTPILMKKLFSAFEEDINYYARKFNQKGFTRGLNYYRAFDLNWELTVPWNGLQIKVPAKFIMGDLDIVYHMPGTKEYIHKSAFKKDVLDLQDAVVMEGVAHFINQEKPEEISTHIYDFIKKF